MKQFSIKQQISLILGISCLLITTHLLPISGLASAQPTQSRTDEIRGVWLTNVGSSVLFAPWGIHRALHQLATLNFNTVYPVVWNRGYTFYPSDTAQHIIGRRQAPLFSVMHPGTDVLKSMIRVGHRHQLNVIPWFEYGFMVPPRSKLAVAHPDDLRRIRRLENWRSDWVCPVVGHSANGASVFCLVDCLECFRLDDGPRCWMGDRRRATSSYQFICE